MACFKSFEEIGARQKAWVTVRFFRRVEAEYETLKQEVGHIKWQEDGSEFEE